MKLLQKVTRSQSSSNHQRVMIQEIMTLLLEPDEQRFSRLLLARLLDEGCNLPLVIALPRLYALMVTNMTAHLSGATQQKIQTLFGNTPCSDHTRFVEMMTFYVMHVEEAKKCLAIEFLNSIDSLKAEWQSEIPIFQQDADRFEQRLLTLMHMLCPQQSLSFHDVRRRVYMAMTTSLLRHFRDSQVFQKAFGSVPQALRAMRHDHTEFVRFLELCQERIPYFPHVAAQVFWRTLETLRLEMCVDKHRHAPKD